MKCSNCIAEGRDYISPLCIADFSSEPTTGIKTFKSGEHGCFMRPDKIIRLTELAMKEHPGRFIQFRDAFQNKT